MNLNDVYRVSIWIASLSWQIRRVRSKALVTDDRESCSCEIHRFRMKRLFQIGLGLGFEGKKDFSIHLPAPTKNLKRKERETNKQTKQS